MLTRILPLVLVLFVLLLGGCVLTPQPTATPPALTIEQGAYGRLRWVHNQGDSYISAALLFINIDTNEVFETISNAEGFYQITLPVGDYVLVSRGGYFGEEIPPTGTEKFDVFVGWVFGGCRRGSPYCPYCDSGTDLVKLHFGSECILKISNGSIMQINPLLFEIIS